MLLREGTKVTLVLGEKSYMGTLKMRTEGIQEYWYIALDEGGEVEIHKREGAVEITDKGQDGCLTDHKGDPLWPASGQR